jgi:acetyltransferase-like isoleucine patch superfamily enzyme
MKKNILWLKPKLKNGKLTKWNWMVQGIEHFTLGRFVDIGAFTYIQARYGVEILDNVQIGSHCSIYSHSTIDNKKGKVIIKSGAKIGTHSTIMPGVTIGENAVIGAYSFVTCDIPANVLAFGIPVKILRKKK